MSEITEHVGQLIREARKKKGMTQKELAEKLSVSEAAVYGYEQGQNFTLETLHRIARAIDISVESMVKGY